MAESADREGTAAAGHRVRRPMTDAFFHLLWLVFRVLLLAWLGLVIVVYIRQSRMLFFPSPVIGMLPSEAGLQFEDVFFTASDGVRLNGWFVPAPGAGVTILMCHGNGGNISDRVWALKQLHDAGFNAFIFDYRGYGRSTGRPITCRIAGASVMATKFSAMICSSTIRMASW